MMAVIQLTFFIVGTTYAPATMMIINSVTQLLSMDFYFEDPTVKP